jgi:hypothetical protein
MPNFTLLQQFKRSRLAMSCSVPCIRASLRLLALDRGTGSTAFGERLSKQLVVEFLSIYRLRLERKGHRLQIEELIGTKTRNDCKLACLRGVETWMPSPISPKERKMDIQREDLRI